MHAATTVALLDGAWGFTTVELKSNFIGARHERLLGRSRRKKVRIRRTGYPEEESPLVYKPQPIDTSDVQLSEEILQLTERLAENAHDIWARQRLADGWTWGPYRDEDRKEHPSLVPYEELPESEKKYDRNTAMETLKAMIALGYRIEKVR